MPRRLRSRGVTSEAGSSWPVFLEVGQVVAVTALIMSAYRSCQATPWNPAALSAWLARRRVRAFPRRPASNVGSSRGENRSASTRCPPGASTLAHSPGRSVSPSTTPPRSSSTPPRLETARARTSRGRRRPAAGPDRRLWWPDPRVYLRDPEGFHRMLRPACRRCTARFGITEPVACYLPPHRTVCRRHRLWIGPAARSHAAQLDISPLPEVFRAQRCRRHLAQLHHPWRLGDAVRDARGAIHHALRGGTWIRASSGGCVSSPPAPGTRPWPARSASAQAGKTAAPATPPSRSPSTPTSSGSPHASSGRKTPTLVRHRETGKVAVTISGAWRRQGRPGAV